MTPSRDTTREAAGYTPPAGGGSRAPASAPPAPRMRRSEAIEEALADFWSVPCETLLARLATSPTGLAEAEAARRLERYGANVVTSRQRTSLLRQVAAQFTSPITILLLVAAIISIAIGERIDGLVILAILAVSALLGFGQERRATGAVQRLLALIRTTVVVVRDGRTREIPLEEVVPGDVVRLAAGASAPGDARILDSEDLFVDQATLTGESFPAEKAAATLPAETALAERTNLVFLGTHVVSGTATVVVVRTGVATEYGEVAHRLALRPPETEFEHGVRRFGYLLLEITMVLALVIFAVNVAIDRPVLDALLFTLALAVGLTPQLLPAIVSVTLAHGARRMARDGVLVRRLASIQDLGGMEVLCADKTGTITAGSVVVHGAEDAAGAPSERVRLFAYLNAAFETGYPNPIDEALRAAPPAGAERFAKVDEVPYDFVRRRLSMAVSDGRQRLLLTKGAVASVLDVCDDAESADGGVRPISEVRGAIERRVEALSQQGFRCLAVARRALADDRPVGRADERGLTFVGILSLTDPLKADAAASLRELKQLGVQVKLVTGDNRHVAARLAAEAGLDAARVCTGAELHHLSEAALVSAAPRIGVFAEVAPTQKERIIRALKASGLAVGYLGDGINDAAALHAADVGISVDSAAASTKQEADIVLLRKDLGVLGRGVREGRRAFANTLKYVFITTSANFGNMFSMAGASLFAAFLPLLPKQILLINVLTDLPAVAIATDRLDPELVARPRRWDTAGIRRFMLAFGLVSSLFDFLTFGALLALRVPPAVFRTAWFIESVLSELLILLVIRTRRAFFGSRPGSALLWTSVAVAAAALLLPVSPLAGVLGFAPLPGRVLALVLAIVLAYVAGSEATKRLLLGRVPL